MYCQYGFDSVAAEYRTSDGFLATHLGSVDTFIHMGMFTLNEQGPEWLATVAAAGSIMTPVPILRRFGFAIHEAVRKWRQMMKCPNEYG